MFVRQDIQGSQKLNEQHNNNSSSNNGNGNGNGNGDSDFVPSSELLDSLDIDMISERLQRFVRNFCLTTSREYSINVAQLISPFVVLSFADEIVSNLRDPNLPQNSEEDWMNLSIKIVENLSLSGLLPYPSAHPILLSVFTQLYFYEWINHMFCGCTDLMFLVQLWDILLFHENQDFYLYFSMALLKSKREQILAIKGTAKDILAVLDEKSIATSVSNQSRLPGLIKHAEIFRKSTPISFLRNWNRFYTSCKHPSGPRLDTINQIYNEYKYSICMGIDVEEMILKSPLGKDPKIREKLQYYIQDDEPIECNLVVFDCRPYKYFKSGRFPNANHLPPGLLISQPEEFDGVKKSFQDIKGISHLAFYDNWFQFNTLLEKNDADTNDNGDMNMNILRFLKEGFPYISKVPSGFKKIHDIFLAKGLELNVHEFNRCPVCNPDALNNPLPPKSQPNSPVVVQPKKENWLMNKFKIGQSRDKQPSTPNKSSPINVTPQSSPQQFIHTSANSNNNSPDTKDRSFTMGSSPLNKSGVRSIMLSPTRLLASSGDNHHNGMPHIGGTNTVHDERFHAEYQQFDKEFQKTGMQFQVDSDDDQEPDDFKNNPRFYYFGSLADIDDEGGHYYRDYNTLLIPNPVFDADREVKVRKQIEESLKEYRGIDEWLEGDHFIYECAEYTTESINTKCYAIVTEDTFMVLKEHPSCGGYVKEDCKYSLAQIQFNPSNPAILEFDLHFDNNSNNKINESQPTEQRKQFLFGDVETINSIQKRSTKLKLKSPPTITQH
ncbi:RabGAP/TBC domain-containing protein [Heterostelium album PN500]|uniref:RabGAP/TBC domain-containing protein n=1 Tax=Heterostelium pallidum (strain ATCC 26659 / Pp 5 / PN500) TaxID=670386 RepID=D3BPL8_HETP5|nr:RabGAP/TBC domain-containing protein [Heterostelium album PN500]EFA76638.1 RabGAP/TBC domain-containing protein [Heterostelium album PN500]|eukprot:XP_020428770.1 RabGAP/TBC domain-containing protein [Heterostelium album PN500]